MKVKNKQTFITIAVIILILSSSFLLLDTMANSKPKGELKEITYEEITKKVANKDSFILIVSQSTCSHCATYKPKVEQICKEHNLDVYYIDYDKYQNKEKFLNEFDLSGATPTTIFFQKGKEKSILNRIEGDIAKEKVIETFKKMGFISK